MAVGVGCDTGGVDLAADGVAPDADVDGDAGRAAGGHGPPRPPDPAWRLALLEELPDGVAVVDDQGRITYLNRSLTELTGHHLDGVVGTNVFDLVHPDDLAYMLWSFDARTTDEGQPGLVVQCRIRTADGRWITAELRGRSLLADPAVGGMVVSVRDMSRQSALADSPARLRSMVDRASDVLLLAGADGRLAYANRRLSSMVGHDADRVVGQPWTVLAVDADRATAEGRFAALVAAGDQATARWRMRLRAVDGTTHPVEVHAVNQLADPVIDGVIVALRDVAELEAMEAKLVAQRDALAHEAAHDPLTGLLNRSAFLDLLEATIAERAAAGGELAVLFVDLDGFKAVNDAHGHHAGDAVLVAVADRLRASLRTGDVVARHGGDEFVVLLEPTPADDELPGLLARIDAALARPVDIGAGQRVVVGASTGAARADADATDVDALLRAADAAMYRAKRSSQQAGPPS